DRVALGVHVLGVFALGVAAAGQERAAPPFADHHRRAALLALVLGRPGSRHRLALGVEVHRHPALRVAGTAQEWPARADPLQHRLAAVGANVLGLDRSLAGRFVAGWLGVIALRIARTPEETGAGLLAETRQQRLAALGADLARRGRLDRFHLVLGLG